MSHFCSNCGTKLEDGQSFCHICGKATPVRPAVPVQPAQPAVPAQPAQPAVPVQPAQPAIPVQPAQPAVPVQPAQPRVPAQAAQPGAYPSYAYQPAGQPAHRP